MKNFSELLDTKLALEITVNGQLIKAGLTDLLMFQLDDIVSIDGIEVLPKYRYLVTDNVLEFNEPFYCWLHRVSGQGWLLEPQ